MNSATKEQMTIGQRIAIIRASRLIRQSGLAAAVGISRNVISNIERSKTTVGLVLAARIAEALHCTTDDLRAPLDAPIPFIRFRGRSNFGEGQRPFCVVAAE